MWYNHPFSQRSKTTERTVGAGVGSDREGGQNLKRGGRQYSGGLHKKGV